MKGTQKSLINKSINYKIKYTINKYYFQLLSMSNYHNVST